MTSCCQGKPGLPLPALRHLMNASFSSDYARNWRAPEASLCIDAIDYHTGGEPTRIILNGFPVPAGSTILERRQYCLQHYDQLRQALMFEPRGHADMYGCLLVPAQREDSDFGVLFMHNEGYSTMCGHATLALIRFAYDSQRFTSAEGIQQIKIDAPCGQILAYAELQQNRLVRSYFDNVASYVYTDHAQLKLDHDRCIDFAIAYGGAYYAMVDADQLGLELSANNAEQIIKLGQRIKLAVQKQIPIQHPDPAAADLGFLYGTIFYSRQSVVHSKNVCVFAAAELDRCPTGSGVSAYAALLHQRGELNLQQTITIESLIGSQFSVSLQAEQSFYQLPAVLPRVEGSAHLCSRQQFYLEAQDPFPQGFLLR